MERHGSPVFYKLLEEMAETHDKKSHDYASNKNPYGNYHFAGEMALLFAHNSKDAGFVGRLAEKIYRLANLESSGKVPTNESIEDTERDIAVITALWMASRRDSRKAPILSNSEEASCKMIELSSQLELGHKRQMRDYLTACIHDDESSKSI